MTTPKSYFSQYYICFQDYLCRGTGIPSKLITDANTRYFVSAKEFEQFSKRWNFEHSTSSPRYPRGNVHAEKAVQAVKCVYEKSSDILLGVLALKTTPIVDPEC